MSCFLFCAVSWGHLPLGSGGYDMIRLYERRPRNVHDDVPLVCFFGCFVTNSPSMQLPLFHSMIHRYLPFACFVPVASRR